MVLDDYPKNMPLKRASLEVKECGMMFCFRHQVRDAVAICKNCGKAACVECCEDSGHGVACCQTCLHELLQANELNSRLRQSLGIGARPPMPASVSTYFFFGLILVMTGVYLSFSRPGIDYLTFAMGAAFFVMSAMTYKRYRDACPSC